MPIMEKKPYFMILHIGTYVKNATITLTKYAKQIIKGEGDYVISNDNILLSHLQRIGLDINMYGTIKEKTSSQGFENLNIWNQLSPQIH